MYVLPSAWHGSPDVFVFATRTLTGMLVTAVAPAADVGAAQMAAIASGSKKADRAMYLAITNLSSSLFRAAMRHS